MTRVLAIGAGVVVALLLVAELVAVPVTTRVLDRLLAGCGFATETLTVVAVDRPVVPRLLVGRARGVELAATGVRVGDLRVERARLELPEAVLPWAPRPPEATEARLELTVTEGDLQDAARATVPLGLPVTVDVVDGAVRLGASGLPVDLEVDVDLDADGTVRLVPRTGDVELFERLGLAGELTTPATVRLTRLVLGDGEVDGSVTITVVPGVGDGDACDEPVAAEVAPRARGDAAGGREDQRWH